MARMNRDVFVGRQTEMKKNNPRWSRSRIILLITVLLMSFTGSSPETGAHPHVFITQSVEVVFDDKGLAGLELRWQFDDMFSSMIAEDHDQNGNGRLEPAEVADIEENAFSHIAEYNYFSFITIDGETFTVDQVTDFQALLRDGRLTYIFFIPCRIAAADGFKKIKLAAYDPSYYTAINFADKNPVSLDGDEGYEVTTRIAEDPETTIYYGMIHPWTLFLEFRSKS
ncbi:MAG: DUF1007 family protein [Desulfosudaceae bacterium]